MAERAQLIKVRVPFRKSRLAWLVDGRKIMLNSHGPLPVGAVILDDTGRMLNLQTGAIYNDSRFNLSA